MNQKLDENFIEFEKILVKSISSKEIAQELQSALKNDCSIASLHSKTLLA